MKKAFIYSIIALLAGCVASCNKTDNALQDGNGIRFAFGSADTRALIENDTQLREKQIQVYDFLDGTQYFGEPVEYDGTAWNFVSGKGYTWKTGVNKFFAYSPGAGTLASQKLTVEKTLTTADEDLLYSDIVTKTKEAGTPITETVTIPMNHLFAAVSITLENVTEDAVTVTGISKPAIPNSSSAEVDFSGDETVVTYSEDGVAVSGDFVTATALTSATLEQDEMIDVLSQAVTEAQNFYVVWPQALPAGDDRIPITVNYSKNDVAYESTVYIPADTWEAGHKYSYVLRFLPTDVQLIFKVMPWDEGEAGEIDTANGSINMSNVTWMNTKLTVGGEEKNTVVTGDYAVYMYYHPTVNGETYTANNGYFPAMGYFTVNYPTSGLFRIGLIPAYGETEVDEDAYEIVIWNGSAFEAIDPEGEEITDETVYFQVRATGSDSAAHKAQIDIWFKPDGSDEWISAYSEIRANYALTIPAI